MAIDSWLAAELLRDGAWVHLGTSSTQLTQAWCGLHTIAEAAVDDSPPAGLTGRTLAASAEYTDDGARTPHWIMLPELRRVLDCVDPAAPLRDDTLAPTTAHFADPEHSDCLGDVRQLLRMLELGPDPDEAAIRILAWWGY